MRLHRTLFIRELRAGLLSEAAILLVVLGGLLLAERFIIRSGTTAAEARESINLFLSVSIALLGFASGARTFPAELKARRFLFWYALPASRRSLWLSFLAGRLLAALLAIMVLLLARYSLLLSLLVPLDPEEKIRWLLACHPVLFAAGASAALTFRKTLTVFLVGLPLALLVSLQVLGALADGFTSHLPQVWCVAILCLFGFFLLLSWRGFQRGETQTLRRRLSSQGFAAVALLFLVALTGIVSWLPGMTEPGSWELDQSIKDPEISIDNLPVSPGGLYLSVLQRLRGWPGYYRVEIVETATGRVIGSRRLRDVLWMGWSAREDVLFVIAVDRSIPAPWRALGDPLAHAILLAPDGSEIERRTAASSGHREQTLDRSFHRSLIRKAEKLGMIDGVLLDLERDAIQEVILQSAATENVAGISWVNARALRRWRSRSGPSLERWATLLESEPGRRHGDSVGIVFWHHGSGNVFALYALPDGKEGGAALYDLSMDREIAFSVCPGQASSPEAFTPHRGPAILVRFRCSGVPPGRPPYRHAAYIPGSGKVIPLPVLDTNLGNTLTVLGYLDEQTAIWRTADTWKVAQGGRFRILWPRSL